MKEYEEIMEKDNRIKKRLSSSLLVILAIMAGTNFAIKNTLSAILATSMFVIMLIVHLILEREAKRKMLNLKKMFKKSK